VVREIEIDFIGAANLSTEAQTEPDQVKRFFMRLTPEHREKWRVTYNELIDREEGRLVRYHKITGKVIQPHLMPWMLPHWKRGLQILTEVIENR